MCGSENKEAPIKTSPWNFSIGCLGEHVGSAVLPGQSRAGVGVSRQVSIRGRLCVGQRTTWRGRNAPFLPAVLREAGQLPKGDALGQYFPIFVKWAPTEGDNCIVQGGEQEKLLAAEGSQA